MDDEDESYKRFQPMKRSEEEQHAAAKKFKKDFTKSTCSPSPSPTGERVNAFTKQTPVWNDFTKSTSSPSPTGERVNAFTKQTPVWNDFTKSTPPTSPNGEEIHAFTKQTPVRNDITKSTSSPSPTGEKIHALTKHTLHANSQQTLQANSQQMGKANSQQTLEANSQQKGKNVVSIETSRRPFVKNWYNDELKNQDKETWDKFNGCFRAIQTSNYKSANQCLSKLESSHLSLQQKLGEVRQLVSRLASFSSTSTSDLLNKKEKDLFSEPSSEEQRNLKARFSQLQTADLVNLGIEDFLELLETLEVQADIVKELESKVEVQKMINFYQQHLIDDNRLLAFFQQLEDRN